MYVSWPSKDSSLNSKSIPTLFPSPSQLFSLILNANVPPFVPTPAPALISPVGFSSIYISIILRSFFEPWITSLFTDLNISLDLSFDIDLSRFRFVNGSPSSNNNSLLITLSLVTLFPFILILSTKIFAPSLILNFKLISSFIIVSSTSCSTNWRLFLVIISSISLFS